jgi:hypothetical protein
MALTNCLRCGKLFRPNGVRDLCGTCFGQHVFGTRPESATRTPLRPPSAPPAPKGRHTEHALRTDIRSQEARAHGPSVNRGISRY